MLQRAHSRRPPRARQDPREDFGLLPVRFVLIGSPRLTGCDRKKGPRIAAVDDGTHVDHFSGTSNILKDIFRIVLPYCVYSLTWQKSQTSSGYFPRTGSRLDVRSIRAREPFGHARLINRAKSGSCSRICRSALLQNSRWRTGERQKKM